MPETLINHYFIKQRECFSFVQEATSVFIKFDPDLVDQGRDLVKFFFLLEKSYELGHFILGYESITVGIELVVESCELRHIGWRLTSLCQYIVDESQSFFSIECAASINIVLVPDIIHNLNYIILFRLEQSDEVCHFSF
mgnify:CR=1 FL=1